MEALGRRHNPFAPDLQMDQKQTCSGVQTPSDCHVDRDGRDAGKPGGGGGPLELDIMSLPDSPRRCHR